MGKMPRVGMLMPGPAAHSAATLTPFYHGLHELGYLEGQNLARRTRARYLAAKDFRSYRFEAKRPGRCLRFSHLQCGRRIATVTMIATRRRPGTRNSSSRLQRRLSATTGQWHCRPVARGIRPHRRRPVSHRREHDRDGWRGLLCRNRGCGCWRDDDIYLPPDEFNKYIIIKSREKTLFAW